MEFAGEANHAGTTRLEDRHDPMLDYAAAVLQARELARKYGIVATCDGAEVEASVSAGRAEVSCTGAEIVIQPADAS